MPPLVVIDDFNVMRAVLFPTETDSKLVVDANAPLSFPVSVKRLQPVAGRNLERLDPDGRVKHVELPQGDAGYCMKTAIVAVSH